MSKVSWRETSSPWGDEPVPSGRKSGFEPLEDEDGDAYGCSHPQHDPPAHMVIPPGRQYRHICPGCGFECVLKPSLVRL